MKNIFALASISILLLQVFPVAAAEPPTTTPSFVQLCSLKNSLPAATKHTIDILLKKAGTEDCQLADTKLGSPIDLKPLAGLNNLSDLQLDRNHSGDVEPVTGLSILKSLNLGCY